VHLRGSVFLLAHSTFGVPPSLGIAGAMPAGTPEWGIVVFYAFR
jgi:hypothetical protein